MSLTVGTGTTDFNGSGTSAVAPLYAGLTAVMIAALGQPIGFLNPTLYALGESVFRDITFGNNLWGDPLNAATHSYTAGPGWEHAPVGASSTATICSRRCSRSSTARWLPYSRSSSPQLKTCPRGSEPFITLKQYQ